MNKLRRQIAIAGRLYETIQNAADAAVNKWNKLCDEYDLKSERLISGTVQDIDEYGVTIDWYESWAYGGYDEGEYTLSVDQLDPETNDELFRRRLQAIYDARQTKADAEKEAREKSERAILAELKEKYPD